MSKFTLTNREIFWKCIKLFFKFQLQRITQQNRNRISSTSTARCSKWSRWKWSCSSPIITFLRCSSATSRRAGEIPKFLATEERHLWTVGIWAETSDNESGRSKLEHFQKRQFFHGPKLAFKRLFNDRSRWQPPIVDNRWWQVHDWQFKNRKREVKDWTRFL